MKLEEKIKRFLVEYFSLVIIYTLFLIRTSHFEAEAGRSVL